jgi:hypothetical protein
LANFFEKVAYRIGVCSVSAQKQERDGEQANPAGRDEAGH